MKQLQAPQSQPFQRKKKKGMTAEITIRPSE
jgi:hypothetical protein